MSQPDASSQGNPTDYLRVSDAERQVVVDRLAQAHAAGQLDLDEFGERTSQAHAARTYADLQPLTADLPGTTAAHAASTASQPQSQSNPPALRYQSKSELKSAARNGDPEAAKKIFFGVASTWVFLSAICTVIWFVGERSDGDGFWPVWVMIGLGFGVFGAFRNWKMR